MEPIILHSDMNNFYASYVGPATTRKLAQFGIHTIGALAQADIDVLYYSLKGERQNFS